MGLIWLVSCSRRSCLFCPYSFLFYHVYQIIAFDELKTDYKNPIDQCNSLNPVRRARHTITYFDLISKIPFEQLVLPEYFIHIFFNLLFLISGEWVTLALNIPLIAYHIHRYINRPVMSGVGLYDPTNIMNADVLSKCQREGWIKLAFYLISFFFYLYGYVFQLDPTTLIFLLFFSFFSPFSMIRSLISSWCAGLRWKEFCRRNNFEQKKDTIILFPCFVWSPAKPGLNKRPGFLFLLPISSWSGFTGRRFIFASWLWDMFCFPSL